ncbi:hypothetical protein TorRG33x02_180340, partial [Trema orientale]
CTATKYLGYKQGISAFSCMVYLIYCLCAYFKGNHSWRISKVKQNHLQFLQKAMSIKLRSPQISKTAFSDIMDTRVCDKTPKKELQKKNCGHYAAEEATTTCFKEERERR